MVNTWLKSTPKGNNDNSATLSLFSGVGSGILSSFTISSAHILLVQQVHSQAEKDSNRDGKREGESKTEIFEE